MALTILDKGERAEIIVEDNGPGISDEEKAKLLKGLGEGMGLTNVARRINLLRSTKISITDGDLGGTRVSILVTKEQEGKQDYEGYISG